MTIVVSLGGSFLFGNHKRITDLNRVIHKSSDDFIVVCGGGTLAREYIKFASSLGLKSDDLHMVGIKSTLLNALIVSKVLNGELYEGDPRKIKAGKLVVTGGFEVGWTTDVCAAYAALASNSKVLFNLSKEAGVYDKDPNKFSDAKQLKTLSFETLYKINHGRRTPGMNFIFDPQAGMVCKKNGIKVVVTNKIEDITYFIKGKEFSGTLIE